MIYSQTPSGLSYAVKRSTGRVAYCSLSIKSGTRAEGNCLEGTAHFVEHTIFKGTQKRSAKNINSVLDKVGGDLNAYTTKEEIVLHATVLKEDMKKAVDLLLELATQATFPQTEIETEKGVVIDEIIFYRDSPSDDIMDSFESRFFAGHSLGRLTLGTEDSVRSITREDLLDYYHRNFIPQNMVLSIVADEEESRLEKLALSLCNKYCPEAVQQNMEPELAPVPSVFAIREDKRNHEANLVLGVEAPSLYDGKKRLTAVLLCNILGGPAGNSLLNAELREKHGWVYAADCNYSQYRDSGLMTISIGCDKENLTNCLKAIARILDKLKCTALSESALKAAKKQLFGQLAISSDSRENQCLSMGKSGLAFGRIISDKESSAIIEAITPEDLRALASEIWADDRVSELIYF